MERVIETFRKYTTDIQYVALSENFEEYKFSLDLTGLDNEISYSDLYEIDSLINPRDRFSLYIKIDSLDPFSFTNENIDDHSYILGNLNSNIDEESEINIEYKIIKGLNKFTRSIYNIDLFYEFLMKLKFEHLLNTFKEYLDTNQLNKFELQQPTEELTYFRSQLFVIGTANKILDNNISDKVARIKILQKRITNSNPQVFSNYDFIPSDFSHLGDYTFHEIQTLMNKVSIVLAASFISNTSNISDTNYTYISIFGHKHIETQSCFWDLDVSNAQIFQSIYEWSYELGDTNDKLALSRNIIARYFTYSNNLWNLPADTLSSIQSAHSIYLKENVEKYIETKNKVAEITTELTVKSKEITQFFMSSFKNNNLTLLTYFMSLFIFNSLSEDASNKIFTNEMYYLSMVFLLISSIYLLITRFQLGKDIQSNIRYFYSMKRIYKDIFDKEELNNLFHKKHLKYNIKQVKQTINIYSYIWLVEIFLLTLLSVILTHYIQI